MKVNIIGRGRGRIKGIKADGLRWTVNRYVAGCDAMFDMHPPEVTPRLAKDRENAVKGNQELITLDNYPIKQIKRYFNTEFFSNSIPYMIALAIYRGATEVDFHGCNIRPTGEEEPICKGHPGVEFWIGVLHGRGIPYKVHGESVLLSLPGGMYGYRWLNG